MKRLAVVLGAALIVAGAAGVVAMRGRAADAIDYRVVATLRTGTMEKELNDAAGAGFRFSAVMGGDTAVGGKEVVAIVSRPAGGGGARYQYRLLATNKTSTMEKELQAASEAGYEYRGQTVFESTFGGKEVVVILEKDREGPSGGYRYKLLKVRPTYDLRALPLTLERNAAIFFRRTEGEGHGEGPRRSARSRTRRSAAGHARHARAQGRAARTHARLGHHRAH
jgi:hypothetical protein